MTHFMNGLPHYPLSVPLHACFSNLISSNQIAYKTHFFKTLTLKRCNILGVKVGMEICLIVEIF